MSQIRSIRFELKHEVGSLVDILMIIKCHELNMTKIQSVPVVGSLTITIFMLIYVGKL